MVINIQIQKKDLYLFSAIVIFLIAVGFVIAQASIPKYQLNGHGYDEIQPCSDGGILQSSGNTWACAYTYGYNHIQQCPDGQVLKMSGGSWTCATAGTLSCTNPSQVCYNGCSVSCPPGYVVTGGGPQYQAGSTVNIDSSSFPDSPTSWFCWWGDYKTNTCYARCCKIS